MIGDTVFAVASPPGAAARGVLRISGPDALSLAAAVLEAELPRTRAARELAVTVRGRRVPCFVLVMIGPASFTGEDVVELHLPGSPLLLAEVSSRLRQRARDAEPGEFTRRAFENGRLDLAAAEAVLDLIHADSISHRRHALFVLQGGLAEAVDEIRARIQDGLASLESGLDFTEGETGEVDPETWLSALRHARERLEQLIAGIPAASPGGDLVLVGAGNAGKSSLCNALAGREAVLVSELAGTTRDVLMVEIGSDLRVLDAPGDLANATGVDRAALELRDRVVGGAAGAILVVDGMAPVVSRTELPIAAVVVTKLDLGTAMDDVELPEVPCFRVSSVTGDGLDALRGFLARRSRGGPSQRRSRLADQLAAAREAVVDAIGAGEAGEPEELVAVDLREALVHCDAVHGRSSPEDLLDRIFGQFCLGK